MPSPHRSARALALAVFLASTAAAPAVLADAGEPVTAGQMSKEAAHAKRLLDDERWGEAAIALKRVTDGEADDDQGNRQIAQLRLAVSLYRLRFHHASLQILTEIARKPNHLEYHEAFYWLVKLATELPEAEGAVESLARSGSPLRSCPSQRREACWQIDYLLGRYEYRNRGYEAAVAQLDRVGVESSYAIPAMLLQGLAYSKLGKPEIARRAFEKAARAVEGSAEHEHLAPLVQHAIACSSFMEALAGARRPYVHRSHVRRSHRRWVCEDLDQWL